MTIDGIAFKQATTNYDTGSIENSSNETPRTKQQYRINPNAVDKTPQDDTVELSTGMSTAKKVGIGALVTAGVLTILGVLGYKGHLGKNIQKFLGGNKKKEMKITEEAKKVYDEISSKLNKKTNINAETIEQNLAPKEKTGAWSKKDMQEYYKNLEQSSPISRNKDKEHPKITKKKHHNEHTSVKGASEPINNTTEQQIVSNIDTSKANSSSRKLTENSSQGLVTPEQQTAYNRSIEYKRMTPKQKEVKANLDAQNAAQRAELNTVENTANGGEKLTAVKAELEKTEEAMKATKNKGYLNPQNNTTYFIENGQVVRITSPTANSKGEYDITDPKKIAKHLAKYNIDVTSFT